MRPPADAEIPAPEFPPRTDWLNVALLRMDRLLGRHAVLVEFWDFARVNSLRTLPYLLSWHERYAGAGLQIVGVHSPGYSFGREAETVERAVERLEIPYSVALDPQLETWRLYGNRGWPGRYLFDRRGLLRYMHYGEGDYRESELAMQECLRELEPDRSFPDPLDPLRREDEPGVLLEPQTADIAPSSDRPRRELGRSWVDGVAWNESADAGAAAEFSSHAGAAFAALS